MQNKVLYQIGCNLMSHNLLNIFVLILYLGVISYIAFNPLILAVGHSNYKF